MNSNNPQQNNIPEEPAANPKRISFPIGPEDSGKRLETVLRRLCPEQPLSRLQKALRQGDVRVDGKKVEGQTRLEDGQTLEIWKALEPRMPNPAGKIKPRVQERLEKHFPEGFEKAVVFNSMGILGVNKPSGILTHPGEEKNEDTLEEFVRFWLADKLPPTLSFRPGPLHRLDKPTSGLIFFSTTPQGAREFSELLSQGKMVKTYLTLLEGNLREPTVCKKQLLRDEEEKITLANGEDEGSGTEFIPVSSHDGLTLCMARIVGGKTHQIRAHAQALGHPLAGDFKYGARSLPPFIQGRSGGQWMLHSWKMEFGDQRFGEKLVVAPWPENWNTVITDYGKGSL